jgi:hypothetical protein
MAAAKAVARRELYYMLGNYNMAVKLSSDLIDPIRKIPISYGLEPNRRSSNMRRESRTMQLLYI